ncbi:anthranilate phosphoribosyltransferase TrpD [Boletus edulis]|nr:anthranilate phosphoribosyltransferase TrpD [Boletus edulis]
MTEHTPDMFKTLLAKLVKTPDDFTPDDLKLALEHLFTSDVVPPTQIGAFLAAMHIHRIERRPENLAAAAQVLRARALKAAVEDDDKDFVVDIVGTGGDGHNTFNVSTAAAIVAAGAGARVVKHGSRASTSTSGSADLLQALDCHFVPPTDSITPTRIPRMPFFFILAPHYHPALALLAPHRKSVPFRTLFNVLGPLINPARPRGMLLGVADHALGRPFAESLREGGVQRALVVCGAEGLDEISCAGETSAWALAPDGSITETVLHPGMFGLGTHGLVKVKGGEAVENATTLTTLLMSSGEGEEELRPVREFVLMNAAALLVVAGVAEDYKDGVRLARESIRSGSAWMALEAFRESGRTAIVNVAK